MNSQEILKSSLKYLLQNKYLGWFNYSSALEMIFRFSSKKRLKIRTDVNRDRKRIEITFSLIW